MKIKLKGIDLKETTLRDITNDPKNIDTDKFVNYIVERLNNANRLIDCKLEELSDIEFYNYLKEVFDIIVDEKDYLRALSKMYNRHYTHFINIKTNMLDSDNNNIEFVGASVPDVLYYEDNRLDLKSIRKITRNNDFLIVEEKKTKDKVLNRERYENHKFIDVDIKKNTLDEDSELFPYLIELLRKDNLVKNILYSVKLYVDHLLYQAKYITNLAQAKHNPEIAMIGQKYEEAYNEVFENDTSLKKRKVSVRLHKDIKYRGK